MKDVDSDKVLRMLFSDSKEEAFLAYSLFDQVIGPPTPAQRLRLAEIILAQGHDLPYVSANEVAGHVSQLVTLHSAEAEDATLRIVELFLKFSKGDRKLIEVGFLEPLEYWQAQVTTQTSLMQLVRKKLSQS